MVNPEPFPHAALPPGGDVLYTVTRLAQDLGVSPRTIRFYEDKGLISPGRAGSTRIYTHRDRARMKLILRGKRLGFSLRAIGEFLELYAADRTQTKQMRALVRSVRQRIEELEEQQAALDQTLDELRELEIEALKVLKARPPRPAPERAVAGQGGGGGPSKSLMRNIDDRYRHCGLYALAIPPGP